MASLPGGPAPRTSIFDEPKPERRFPALPVSIAFAAIVILVGVSALLSHKTAPKPAANTLQPLAAYAPNLQLSDVSISESTSLSGGKSTYIDGKVANKGSATVTGITVQVVFANDNAMPPELDTEPLSLIRTREPYVDTQPVSASPLAPGRQAEFRLIFENIKPNWNKRLPEIRVIGVTTR